MLKRFIPTSLVAAPEAAQIVGIRAVEAERMFGDVELVGEGVGCGLAMRPAGSTAKRTPH